MLISRDFYGTRNETLLKALGYFDKHASSCDGYLATILTSM